MALFEYFPNYIWNLSVAIALESGHIDVERASGLMKLFLKNRWLGLWPILYGDQVRQTALDNWIFQGTLDIEHLPGPTHEEVV